MARLLTILLLAVALVPVLASGPAAAKGPAHPARPRATVAVATGIAERYWGATPCHGRVKVLAARPLPSVLDPTTDGWASFSSSLGPNRLDAPPATYARCTISLARWQWATRSDMEYDWGMFCLTVVHEMGHLLGHKHSLKPGSVMAPSFTSHANIPPSCNAAWLPGHR